MMVVPEITVSELKKLQAQQDIFLLDVREQHEYDSDNIGGYLIPLGELQDRLDEIDTNKPVVVHCKSGMRSAAAVDLLQKAGIDAKNLKGGILAWNDKK